MSDEIPDDSWSAERLGGFCARSQRRLAIDAWQFGRALNLAFEKVKQVKHGKWGAWKKRFVPYLTRSSENRYRTLAERLCEADLEGVGLTEAYRLLDLVPARGRGVSGRFQGAPYAAPAGDGPGDADGPGSRRPATAARVSPVSGSCGLPPGVGVPEYEAVAPVRVGEVPAEALARLEPAFPHPRHCPGVGPVDPVPEPAPRTDSLPTGVGLVDPVSKPEARTDSPPTGVGPAEPASQAERGGPPDEGEGTAVAAPDDDDPEGRYQHALLAARSRMVRLEAWADWLEQLGPTFRTRMWGRYGAPGVAEELTRTAERLTWVAAHLAG